MRRLLIVLFCSLFAAMIAPSQAAAAPYPVTPFNVPYGNTYTTGTVTFYNRQATVVGEQKAVATSGCRYTVGTAYTLDNRPLGTNRSQVTCNGSERYQFNVPANVAGGAAYVEVDLHYYTSPNDDRMLVGMVVYP